MVGRLFLLCFFLFWTIVEWQAGMGSCTANRFLIKTLGVKPSFTTMNKAIKDKGKASEKSSVLFSTWLKNNGSERIEFLLDTLS